jgi:hypothetical protein
MQKMVTNKECTTAHPKRLLKKANRQNFSVKNVHTKNVSVITKFLTPRLVKMYPSTDFRFQYGLPVPNGLIVAPNVKIKSARKYLYPL